MYSRNLYERSRRLTTRREAVRDRRTQDSPEGGIVCEDHWRAVAQWWASTAHWCGDPP